MSARIVGGLAARAAALREGLFEKPGQLDARPRRVHHGRFALADDTRGGLDRGDTERPQANLGKERANASNHREPLFERTALAPVPVVETADEATARARSLLVNAAGAAAERWAGGDGQRIARLLEAPSVADDTQAVRARMLNLVALEIDAPEKRAIAAEPAGLAKRRKVGRGRGRDQNCDPSTGFVTSITG